MSARKVRSDIQANARRKLKTRYEAVSRDRPTGLGLEQLCSVESSHVLSICLQPKLSPGLPHKWLSQTTEPYSAGQFQFDRSVHDSGMLKSRLVHVGDWLRSTTQEETTVMDDDCQLVLGIS